MNHRCRSAYGRPRRSRGGHYAAAPPRTPYEQSLAFVRNEFFNLDPFAYHRFLHFYRVQYGPGAEAYLQETYASWAAGTTRMSPQTERRILECVPRFLDREKQFRILAFYIPSVIAQQKAALKSGAIRVSQMSRSYTRLSAAILAGDYELDWFVARAFSDGEIAEFVQLFRYMMIDALRRSYVAVRDDIESLQRALLHADGGVSIDYTISLLACPLVVDAPAPALSDQPVIRLDPPALASDFQSQHREILTEYTLQAEQTDTTGAMKRHVALSDLQSVIRELRRVQAGQEYDSTVVLDGHGGNAVIGIEERNIARFRCAIATEAAKIAALVIVWAALTLWIIPQSFRIVMFYPGLFVLFGLISYSGARLNKLRSELKDYGRKQRARIADYGT